MYYDSPVVNNVYSSFPVNISEEDNQYLVTAELAGFNDDDVEITLNDNLLVISASKIKKADKKEKEKEFKYLLRERVQRQYKRTFSLPKDSDREAIKASLKDGLLNLSIGKKPEAKPLSIKIN
eukprot:NODE_2737_length_477_cov_187.039720_g2156_i0.p1 GENE.NODE_2737_length_477_cov_187.039720_g2156_i0~~NODE_2737_length_477_cov_187.039720_g2156_i0.p1  ORF type:complete len:142 (-),score=19.59 NODE_2737_length_477_cov_187.039720_g2156_i0:51-419(-)